MAYTEVQAFRKMQAEIMMGSVEEPKCQRKKNGADPRELWRKAVIRGPRKTAGDIQ
jgi:hypothetical protein